MAVPTYGVFEVFTPTTQARLNFVERGEVNDRLVDALRTPGKQLIVYGESGSGKSTLILKKLEQLYPDHITTRCSVGLTFDQLLVDAFDQLDPYFLAASTEVRSRSISPSVSADFSRIRASLDASLTRQRGSESRRVVPPQLTPQRLGEFLGAQGLCWVLEDFHKMASSEKKPLAQALKVFSDLASHHPLVKIVAIGATDTARQVVEYDPEMSNRVAELHVPLMSDEELHEILANGQQLLNLDFGMVAHHIVQFSMGVPSVCHQLALNSCLQRGIQDRGDTRIDLGEDDLTAAVERYVAESSDTLKGTFDRALRRHRVRKYDNCRLILRVLAGGPLEGLTFSQIFSEIREDEGQYPPGNLTQYLDALTSEARGNVLRRDVAGRFRFAEPLYHTYAKAVLRANDPIRVEITEHLIEELTEGLLSIIRSQTSR